MALAGVVAIPFLARNAGLIGVALIYDNLSNYIPHQNLADNLRRCVVDEFADRKARSP